MPLTMPQRSRCRAAVVAAAMVSLPLTACSFADGDRTSSDTRRVSAAGISFGVPASWEEVDPEGRAEDLGEDSAFSEYADQLGISPDQLEQAMGGFDLVLVSAEDEPPGNLNVARVPGRMPTDRQTRRLIGRVGGDVHEVSREQTELGDTMLVVYELDVNGTRIPGQTIYVDAGDGLLSISFGSEDEDTADDLADGILDTLAEAS
jgi:hypothetical protein